MHFGFPHVEGGLLGLGSIILLSETVEAAEGSQHQHPAHHDRPWKCQCARPLWKASEQRGTRMKGRQKEIGLGSSRVVLTVGLGEGDCVDGGSGQDDGGEELHGDEG